MKVNILQENLSKALSLASRFISSKNQLPILNNFLLEAKEGRLCVSATSLEMSISIMLPAKIDQEGAVAISARVLTELINGLPKEKIELEEKDAILKVVSPNHRSSLNGMGAAEFPSLIKGGQKTDFVFEVKTLVEVSQQVTFAASIDEGRPSLTGVLVMVKKDLVTFVATDGFRLSLKRISLPKDSPKDETSFILPAKALLEAGKISQEKGQEDKKVGLSLLPDGNQAVFFWEDLVLSSRLIDGKFPPYEKIIPSEFTTKVTLDKEEFLKSIKLASIFARESANIIKLKTQGQKIKISANTPQVGENENEVEAKVEGVENEIAFNSRYLLDYLNSAASEQIQLEMTGPLNPGVFKTGDAGFLHIIMPVRVQG